MTARSSRDDAAQAQAPGLRSHRVSPFQPLLPEIKVVSIVSLSLFMLAVPLLAAVLFTFWPERWSSRRWYLEPSSLFGWVTLTALAVALIIPHG